MGGLDAGAILCYDTGRFFTFSFKYPPMPQMSYSGNPSVSSDVRQRILTTFDQTLELAREGNRQEALLGCDFVLRMDPQFQPAQVLQERLRSGDGPVRVDDLKDAPKPAAGSPPDDPFADLDSLGLDLPDLLPGDAPRGEIQSLFDQRRFPELMATAQREAATVNSDLELQRLVSQAQELMEAEPYVLKFLTSARQAVQAGQGEEAGRLLDKARSLDPGHPGIAEIEQARSALGAAAPPFALPSPLQTTAMPASLAFGGGDSESDRRIQELLAEGQAAFDSGDPQGAIDAWSRIFLIDIDHREASRRIEGARKLKAESERQVEEIYHDGLGRLEAGDVAGARQAFQRVLEIQPGYYAAREYLQQLDAGVVPAPRPTASRAVAEPVMAVPSDVEVSGRGGGPDLKEEILVPPDPGEAAAPAPERRAPRRTVAVRDGRRARRLFMLVGGAVLLIALAGGWFAWQNWDRLFPNSEDETALPKLSQDPIAKAERLHKAGKTAIALKQLQKLPPTDPNYARAQKLLAQWGGAGSAAGAPAAARPAPAANPVLSRRDLLMAAARQAYSERRYLRAVHRLEQASALGKLAPEEAKMLAEAQAVLEPMATQITAFRDHEWEYVLPELWRMHNADPGNRDVTEMIVDCYYNLAVRDLQRADAKSAAANFQEALNIEKDDESVKRHLVFAQTYEERPKDLLYKIYVKYLQYR